MRYLLKILFFPLKFIYTLYVWFICITFFVSHFLLAFLILQWLPNFENRNYWSSVWFLRVGLRLSGISFEIQSASHFPQDNPFIVISNHQSLLDIPLLMSVSPRKLSFVAKKELLDVPILGWHIRSQGHVSIDRQDAKSATRLLARLKDLVRQEKTLLFFPEGTRSFSDEIGPFKRGAFQMALTAGVPVIPVFLDGSGYILRKKQLFFRPGKMVVRVGNEIDTSSADIDAKLLMDKARTQILELQSKSLLS